MSSPYINIHCHRAGTAETISVQNQYVTIQFDLEPLLVSGLFRSIGIHPWFTSEQHFPEQWTVMQAALRQYEYVAIGECGLDRIRGPRFSFQQEILRNHCLLAQELKKPLILHLVKSYSDILAFQKKYRFTCSMIIHGFTGNKTETEKLIDAGFFLSFGQALLRDSPKVQQAFDVCPIENLFLETDTSDLPISIIYQKAAKLKGLSLPQLTEAIYRNFQRIV